ncbi:hypothetical protein FRC12_016866 [Ceratobasidium sp. 428]|nr:hypothetical protein FRC12_016866 [Ceratobasidium sp. 428]
MLDTISSRVFHTPELLGIICGFCAGEDLARLIRTSEYTFKVVVPRIWNNLESVQPLLSLLSPTVVPKGDPYEHLDVALPAYSSEAFARFDLYCPLIQRLHVSNLWKTDESDIIKFSVSSLQCLADRGSPLPNLRDLALSKDYGFDEEILLWLSNFVPPELRSLIVFFDHGLAQPIMIIALDLLQDKCPGLKRLAILSQTAQMDSSPVVLRHLRGLQSLTSLRVHGCFVDSEFLVTVSCLPKLERFEITNKLPYYDSVLEVLKSTPLPDDSFPALTAFNVVSGRLDVTISSFQGASWQMEQSMVVRARYLSDRDDVLSTPKEPVLSHLAFVASRFKPRLWLLYLGRIPLNWRQPPSTIFEDPNWKYFGRYPLVQLGVLNSSPDPLFIQESFPPLPALSYLDMPDQFLTLSQLAYVGQQMPRLCALRSNLVDVLDEAPQTQHHSTAPLDTIKLFQPLKKRLEIRSPDQVAR